MQHYDTKPIEHKKCITDQAKAENKAAVQINNWRRRENWEVSNELKILNALGWQRGYSWTTEEVDALNKYILCNIVVIMEWIGARY